MRLGLVVLCCFVSAVFCVTFSNSNLRDFPKDPIADWRNLQAEEREWQGIPKALQYRRNTHDLSLGLVGGSYTRAPEDIMRYATSVPMWYNEEHKKEFLADGYVEDGIHNPASVVNEVDAFADPRIPAMLWPLYSHLRARMNADPLESNPVIKLQKQKEFWEDYDEVSPNDTGMSRMEAELTDPQDMNKLSESWNNKFSVDSTVPDHDDPAVGFGGRKHLYNPGNARKNLNKLFPPDNGVTGNKDPIVHYLDHSLREWKNSPATPRHYFPIPEHKYIRVPDRASGRFMGDTWKLGKLIRGYRHDSALTRNMDPTIEKFMYRVNGGDYDPVDGLGEPVAEKPLVARTGNDMKGDIYYKPRPEPEWYQPYPPLSENPFRKRSKNPDFR